MEQVPDVHLYCAQLHEDGLLETVPSEDNIVEFRLSPTGRSIVDQTTLDVPPTKYTIYNQLRTKERANAQLRDKIYALLKECKRFICLLEVQTLLHVQISIPELSSVMYGLLYTKKIVVCGPLFGLLPTEPLPE